MKPVPMTSAERDTADARYMDELRAITYVGCTKAQMPEIARQMRVVHCRRHPHMEAVYASIGLSLSPGEPAFHQIPTER